MGFERAVEVKLKESIVIYMLAVFFPWVAFFLRGGIFQLYSALFFGSFLVIIFLLLFFLGNRVFSIYLLLESFLWVILTTWCCLVMHEDQRQKDNGITYQWD
ncbi:hypothetical protein HpDR35_00740 [Helicobacter pylori]